MTGRTVDREHLPRRMPGWQGLAIAMALLAACAYPTRNEALTASAGPQRYDWNARAADDMPETLVIVTASGGGTRATALTLAALRTMGDIPLRNGRSLADEVDIISSVSGGSVAAAYFAMHGTKGLADLEKNFLRRNVMSPLVVRGLNPIGLAELSTPGTERIDLLIDYFDRKELFNDETFDFFLRNPRQPYLILNAADMVEGTPFPFTQYTLDLLCSDLGRIKISTAVAASAAFPVALSPVTLKNYSVATSPHCPPNKRDPAWVKAAAGTSWSTEPSRALRGRSADAYLTGAKSYVHLLDGGIADNLGLAEPYRLLTTVDVSPRLRTQIGKGEIEQIIFVMINARSFKPSDLDHAPDTPGMIPMLLASIDSPIDRTSFGAAERIRKLLDEEWANKAREASEAGDKELSKRFRSIAAKSKFLSIELDAIDDVDCRRKMQTIPTSWSLEDKQVDATLDMGRALLLDNPELPAALGMVGGNPPAPPGGNVDAVCRSLQNVSW